MRVGLHDYRTDPLLPQKDGANLAHENIAALLRTADDPEIETHFHDFTRLIADEYYAREMLTGVDCVVSNVGPHAHYYHWLRARLGLGFRIVRDVRTAIWSSYLLQEHLCQPYLLPGDTLLVASHYTWGIYHRMFPHLAGFSTALCYPMTACFPSRRPDVRPPSQPINGIFTLGYLGRLSEDKNFPDILELLIRLNQVAGSRFRLIACGEIHSPSCAPERVRARLVAALGTDDCFDYVPACANEEIWDLLARFDVLIFPSTSNLETLGRVLVEASFARVPVICGDHAAGSELVTPNGICSVDYYHGETFSAHFDHCLGRVAIDAMAHAVTSGRLAASDCYDRYNVHPDAFLKLLRSPPPVAGSAALSPAQAAFIDTVSVDLPPALDHAQADLILAELSDWFVDLQRKGDPRQTRRLGQLRDISCHPKRTADFIEKVAVTQGDFTNIGGIDIELCHVCSFYPTFTLTSLHDPSTPHPTRVLAVEDMS